MATETEALRLPAVTVTVAEPAAAPAVNRPVELTVPPLADQVKTGGLAMALPNWSVALAVNCWTPPAVTLACVGLTATLVRVWLTVTLTLLVVLRPFGSLMVTWKV